MVNSCAAYNCTERYRKGGVAFHSFPASKELREKWIKALRRSNFTPNRYSKLCAKHFTPDCYETAPWSYMKRLKKGAVPTLFEFTQKRKYQKKSLDDSPVRSQDSYSLHTQKGSFLNNYILRTVYRGVATGCNWILTFNRIPVSRSPGRRKQLIIERKEFNTSDADPSESHPVKFPSKQKKQSEDIVEPENNASLPSKRCRKKKTFSNDFVSEDWTSKRRGRSNKPGKEGEEAKNLSVKVGKLGLVKEINILETEKETAPQDAPSGMFSGSKNNDSSAEICEGLESSNDGRERTNVECRSAEKITVNEAMNGSDGIILKTISCTIPCEASIEKIQSECNQITIRDQEKHILVESTGAGGFFFQKSTVSDSTGLEMGNVNIEDFFKASNNVKNVNENLQRNAVSELIVAATALQDISTSQEHIAMIDTNVGGVIAAKNIDNCNTSSKNVAASSTSTSNQKDSSVFKLNLEEEEAMLQRCKQLGEAAKRKKLVRLKKVISGSGREPVSGNQMQKNSSTEDVVLKNSRRKSYLGDFKQEDLVSPEKAAKCLKVAQKRLSKNVTKVVTQSRKLFSGKGQMPRVASHPVFKGMVQVYDDLFPSPDVQYVGLSLKRGQSLGFMLLLSPKSMCSFTLVRNRYIDHERRSDNRAIQPLQVNDINGGPLEVFNIRDQDFVCDKGLSSVYTIMVLEREITCKFNNHVFECPSLK
ncbi:hypothetical protein J437_LFUL006678 [Ladona fulva]|uniref:THAP-type domain-containing protein n=1 Tax=Ladona fulva TaxID=123851 RepID=A0A8K0P2L8_LADFU|nr:hypothetical protein J437_LFUL006678 [Ladona fulva]